MSAYKKCILFLFSIVFLLYACALAAFQLFRQQIHEQVVNRIYENVEIVTSQIDESLTETISRMLSLLSGVQYAKGNEEMLRGILDEINQQVSSSPYVLNASLSTGASESSPGRQEDGPYLTLEGSWLELRLRGGGALLTLSVDSTALLREVVRNVHMDNAVLLPSDSGETLPYRGGAEQMEPLPDSSRPFQRKSTQLLTLGGEECLVIRMPLHALSSSVAAVFKTKSVFAQDAFWNHMIVIASLAALVCFGAGCVVLHRVIHRPLRRLVDAFSALDHGDLDIQIESRPNDEFRYIFTSFNQMTQGLKNVIDQNYRQVIKMQRAELRQLYLQVNPHFLYNCFSNISSLCTCGDYEAIKPFTRRLSSYYHYIMAYEELDTTFEKEYNHAVDYIEIQNIRFGGRIRAEYTPPEALAALAEIRVPKMMIQPLIENSYKHVLEQMPSGGRLELTALGEPDGSLTIRVSDNGDTLSDADIERLAQQMRSDATEGGVGLANVCRRLRLYDGRRASMSLRRGALGGLEVSITLEGGARSC